MRILITGMSGTGKSTVVTALVRAGQHAIDLDADGWSGWAPCKGNPTGAKPGHDWLWDEARLSVLLANVADEPLFVADCAPNMGRFTPFFDRIILLSAPAETLLERTAARTNNPYGKERAEAQRIIANLREVEPALRQVATHEVDTTQTPEIVLDAVMLAAR